MPVIPSLVLTNQLPIKTYTASVVVSSSAFQGRACSIPADGLGNQITLMDVTSSYTLSSSFEQEYEISSSWASRSFAATSASWASSSFFATTASWSSRSFVATSASWASASATASYIYPAIGSISNLQNPTGSAIGDTNSGSFSSKTELAAFILAVSQSFITLNGLIADLRSLGLIT